MNSMGRSQGLVADVLPFELLARLGSCYENPCSFGIASKWVRGGTYPSACDIVSAHHSLWAATGMQVTTAEKLISLLDEYYRAHPLPMRPFTIVEAGCLRSENEGAEEGDGWSTLAFARWIHDREAWFFTMDISEEALDIAKRQIILRKLVSLNIRFYQGDSVQLIESFNFPIDFAYLDTSDDLEHGLAEFQAAEVKGAGRIVMDDFATKAQMAALYAQGKGYKVVRDGRFTVIDLRP